MRTHPSLSVVEPDGSTIHDARQRRTILIAVCVALMAVIASVTGLNVARPELAVDFNASQSQVLWFINLYTLSLAALLLPLGALGDRWGRKPMLLNGLIVFGAANVAAGLATSSVVCRIDEVGPEVTSQRDWDAPPSSWSNRSSAPSCRYKPTAPFAGSLTGNGSSANIRRRPAPTLNTSRFRTFRTSTPPTGPHWQPPLIERLLTRAR